MKKFFYVLLIAFLFSNVAFADVETAETIYAKAYAHIYKNSPKTAISIFQKGINTYPNCAFLYAGMGDAYLKEGNYQKAMELFTTAQRQKYAIDAYKLDFYYASLLKNKQDINNALNEITVATKSLDNDVLYKNINAILNENYDKATFILDIYPMDNIQEDDNSRYFSNRENKLKQYLQILSANPEDFQAANNAGVELIYLKDYQLAEKYLKQALANNPSSAIILNNLAIASLYLNKTNDMNNYFNQALKENSDYIPTKNNKAVAKIQLGLADYKTQNVNSILDIAKKDNDNLYAWRILSLMYSLNGDYKNAYNLINQFESDYNFQLYKQKAYNAFKNKNYSNALNYVEKAIALYSHEASFYELKGRILLAMGDYNAAKTNFRQASQRDAKLATTNYYLARAMYYSGDKVSAEVLMREFLSTKKGNSETTKINLLFE